MAENTRTNINQKEQIMDRQKFAIELQRMAENFAQEVQRIKARMAIEAGGGQEAQEAQERFAPENKAERAAQNALFASKHVAKPRHTATGEKRNKRLNLVLRPSVYQVIAAWAEARGKTLSGALEAIILDYCTGKKEA